MSLEKERLKNMIELAKSFYIAGIKDVSYELGFYETYPQLTFKEYSLRHWDNSTSKKLHDALLLALDEESSG